MIEDPEFCAPFSDLLAELALGVLTGRERAEVLAHLQDCPRCSAELDGLAAVADGLLEVVPGADPPLGFEVRVLDRLALHAPPRQRFGRRGVAVRLVLASLIALSGIALGLDLSSSPAPTLPSATTKAGPITATILASQRSHGEALLYRGNPGWLVMVVKDLKGVTLVRCSVTTKAGQTLTVGSFSLDNGSGTWSATLPVAASSVRTATVALPSGVVLGTANL